MGSHSFTCHPHTNHTCFYSQSQGITTLWLVFIAFTHEGMARLSWSGWLVAYRDKCPSPHRKLNPDMVTHLSTNRAWHWSTLLIEANTLTTTPDHHSDKLLHLFSYSHTRSLRNRTESYTQKRTCQIGCQ